MTSSVRSGAVQAVQSTLKTHGTALDTAAQKVISYGKDVAKKTKESLDTLDEQQRRFFSFDGLRSGVFWVGCVCNVVTLILLVYFLFVR
jgi:hypothetical protein